MRPVFRGRYQGHRPLTLEQSARQRERCDRLLARLDTSWPEAGYVIESDDREVNHCTAFCYDHAKMVALGESIIHGAEHFIMNVSLGESDHEEWCAFHGCNKPVNTGSPTDCWIDSALGLTETDPYACSVTPYELARSAANMLETDKRWSVWFKQAKRVICEARTSR